ncbi:MAG TPA: xanthine dehydrogenase family protein subunit M [candidate division Zixibacteria bacterium]|nr:xanthine dehydrogenase family protein subunit M [candidate division Zixibacteria bacterium]
MYPASFRYLRPRSLAEALEFLTRHGEEAKLLAGGHSLLPAMKLRLASPRYLIDIGGLRELRGIDTSPGEMVIGALTLHAEIAASDSVRRLLPGLAEAASVIGDLQVRNRGTIGGSVAHADPGADFPVILTALSAAFVLQSSSGKRRVAADGFFRDFFTTALAPDEILTEIRIPLPPRGAGTAYAKLGHPASGYAVVSAGAWLIVDSAGNCESARVAVGGLDGIPRRAAATEAALQGRPLTAENIAAAAARAADGAKAEGDTYASAEYKLHVATVFARRAIEAAAGRAGRQDRA